MPQARSREFHAEGEHRYDHSTPARWVLSHTLRYPLFVVLMAGASVINNIAYGNIQLYIGKSFDRIVTPGWVVADLIALVLVIVGSAVVQGVTGLARNYSVEFLAQAIERDTREEYYASLLEKSQTFHGRQRVGDLMARATYDVHTLNLMFITRDHADPGLGPDLRGAHGHDRRHPPAAAPDPGPVLGRPVPHGLGIQPPPEAREPGPAGPVREAVRRAGGGGGRHRDRQVQRAGGLRAGGSSPARPGCSGTTS